MIKAHREAEHNRTQFQIDRIAFFSDAVIAIALTLMILEIKIPEMDRDMTIRMILNKYGWISPGMQWLCWSRFLPLEIYG